MKLTPKVTIVFFTLILLLFLNASISYAAIPRLISYQGKLLGANGQPMAESEASLIFEFYTNQSGGNPIWEESHTNVPLDNGIFTVMLGSVTPFPTSLAFDVPYYLETRVNDDLMGPRQRMTSVGYAFRAEDANKLAGRDPSSYMSQGEPAGGVLTGTYPNPGIANGTITPDKLAPFVAGDKPLIFDDPAIHAGSSASWGKAKEIVLGTRYGEFRIKFTLSTARTSGCIYRNGAPIGTERYTSTGNQEFTEDIAGWQPGDLLQVYGKDTPGQAGYIGKLRIYADM